MNGKIKYYLLAGAAGFVFTYLFSSANNVWSTALYRAGIAFVVWFLLALILERVISVVFSPVSPKNDNKQQDPRGSQLDLATPAEDDEELMRIMKNEPADKAEEDGFTPLSPPKLVTTKNPEELAKAVRHLTEK
ncbi:hypothetical protein [Paenibacillus lemnae]|uniref:Uncharacterized protein n=1 Tax=Paenibacillus lemnae TaxID=1330551 RepID=A0A848M7X7_PAELE|nr:hypothetical protein [Paenibacillus lemnae]NMO96182.1 hypothetical protein [Paenibacillus lemnae]